MIVDMSGVSLVLDDRRVLDSVDLRISEGQSWAVVGPNGAGKTALLSVINGYRWPTEGDVAVLGKRFGETDLRELRRKVGLVSSYLNGRIPPGERVVDLVISGKYASPRLWRKVRSAEEKEAESILEMMGCSRYKDSRANEISQGERQKVLIARALMARPELLILDEPCEALDLRAREIFLEGLTAIAKRGAPSLLVVTHRLEEIPEGFTHALLLKGGKVVAQGPIRQVLTSDKMTECFDTEVEVRRSGGRYHVFT